MKKIFWVVVLPFLAVLLMAIVFVYGLSFFSIIQSTPMSDSPQKDTISWIPEESYFVDYKINNDIVTFRYSICFYNDTEDPIEISLGAKFKSAELKGWFNCEDNFLEGLGEDGEHKYEVLNSKEKKNIIFCFKGDYLGEKVNTNISFPEEILPVFADP